MANLSPAGGLLFATSQEIADSGIISAQGFAGAVAWAWTLEGVPPARFDPGAAFNVIEGGSTLTVEYIPDPSLFPFTIRYLTPDGTPVEIDDWSLLPPPDLAPEVVLLRPDEFISKVTFNLAVTASGEDVNTNEPVQASGNYTIDIFANYSLNRDLLTGAIDARS